MSKKPTLKELQMQLELAKNIHAALDAEGHQVWYYGRWRPERVYGHGRLRRFKM
ncbi:hypothetical protein RZR38_24675 [Citrobacter freundii]|uniref:hypothetical protein n=1 Tax=Enterobacteriaceae TaxID=543 RepID=UPI00143153D9|nr:MULTISPECIES: hypothetical protein [Enterobacteriaceae]EGV0674104.1 hypothetical protein [Escherichia coli]MCL1405257.1 hypothetical protein [Enterobacter hormaechei]MCL1410303.1 hypothetical protein [Enterobacter hormaechei]MCL1435574.1 hypothetical protein [Enterobacter hormaechei]MCL1440606.1 hypothetical protein [Enterobacter hormaechei]